MTETQLLISYVTLAIASVGAVLGIMNTWRSFDRDRIRLKVLPHWAIPSAGNPRFCIKVVNLSYIPVTVTFVYFKMRTENRNYVFPPSPPGETLPARMEPRSSITIFMPEGAERDPMLADLKYAHVETACGRAFRRTNGSLKHLIKKARKQQVA